jgi:deoxyribodipyrimidine photo-lyase
MSALVWLHGGSLSETDPAMQENPNAPAIFVFDRPFLETNRISFARLQFMFEGALSALRNRTHKRACVGVQAEEIAAYAHELGCTSIHATQVYTPELEGTLDSLEAMGFEIVVYAQDRLTSYSGEVKRFSKFWRAVEREVLG